MLSISYSFGAYYLWYKGQNMGYKYPRIGKHTLTVKRGLSGFGVFADDETIRRRDFLIEYYGPIVTNDQADKVGGKYLFRLEGGKTILGNHKENVARFLNHSCKPNCFAEMDGTRIFIYAKRRIEKGEELTYNYGKAYWEDFIKPYGCRCAACRP
jgi:uncharacterized protein